MDVKQMLKTFANFGSDIRIDIKRNEVFNCWILDDNDVYFQAEIDTINKTIEYSVITQSECNKIDINAFEKLQSFCTIIATDYEVI